MFLHGITQIFFIFDTKETAVNSTENIFINHTSDTPVFFADSSLGSKTAGTCDLFMLVEQPAIQITLKERRTGQLLAFEVIPLKDKKKTGWKDILENTSTQSKILRNYEFIKVTIGIMSPEYTLVPEALFKPGDEKTYFGKNYPLSEDKIVHVQHIPEFNLYSVFGIEQELEKELNHLFQDPRLWHYSTAFLYGIGMHMNLDAGKQLWLNIRMNKIDIIVSENKKLLLINSYSWQTNEDILYYTLFVCEQLELNPEKIPITVTGEIENRSLLYQLLINYIMDITIPEKPSAFSPSIALDNIPFHHHAILYNLALCE